MSFDKAYRMHNLIFYLFLTTIPHGINNLIKVFIRRNMTVKNNKKTVFGWSMYDWAKSAYETTTLGALCLFIL